MMEMTEHDLKKCKEIIDEDGKELQEILLRIFKKYPETYYSFTKALEEK